MQAFNRRGVRIGALTVLAQLALPAWALEPIDTDGPDYIESSEVVPKGHFQYEIDVVAERSRRSAPEVQNFSTPSLFKYGFADNLELRIAAEGYLRQDGTSGLGDSAIGIKWHAQSKDAQQGKPAVSWLLHFDTPSGAERLKGNGIRPSLRSVIAWDLPLDMAFGLMPGFKYDTGDDAHRFGSLSLGASLSKRLADRLRAFIEFSAPQIARGKDGGVLASWDLGAAYLVNNDLQLGVRSGVAANLNTPRKYVLFEVAQRF